MTSPTLLPPGRFSIDGDGIAWLVLDQPDKKVNTLSSRFFGWFEEVFSTAARERPAALVIVSAKPGVFLAGADLEELRAVESPAAVRVLLDRGHALTRQLEALPCRTIAAIDGAALGGGLELALACQVRIATSDPKTRLGLPEVQLGLIPGLGGSQRLPRRIGVPAALDLLLSGRSLDARAARRLGLVDEVVAPADLVTAARALSRGPLPPRPKAVLGSRLGNAIARVPLVGDLVYGRARREVLAKTGGHYPAPLALLDVVRRGTRTSLDRGLAIEAEAFSRLVVTDAAKSLLGIFFRKNAVEARAAEIARAGRPLDGRIGVVGAGLMGAGIAEVLVGKGISVVLRDRDRPSVERGVAAVAATYDERVRRRRMSEAERRTVLSRLHATNRWEDFSGAELVIEAVFEDREVKHQVIRELEAITTRSGRPRIFASNTSTIPIAELAAASRHPERVVGMHFFSPVGKMPLLEVIRHPGTSAETLGAAVELGRRMGKTVIVVADGAGFFTSRVLAPFLNEATWLLTEGARIDEIDRAMRDWGWPVGPLTLLDEVGLDVAHHASGVVSRLGTRLAPPPLFAGMLAEGRRGKKAGRGFYRYDGGAKRVDEDVYRLLGWTPRPVPAGEIVERTFLQMLNESARCLEEGIVASEDDVDLAVVLGFGFPPFRGGLLEEAARQGWGRIVERLEHYQGRFGERFAPAEWLVGRAGEGAVRV